MGNMGLRCIEHVENGSSYCSVGYNYQQISKYPLVIKHGNGKSPMNGGFIVLIGKSLISGPFFIAMFDYWRVQYNVEPQTQSSINGEKSEPQG